MSLPCKIIIHNVLSICSSIFLLFTTLPVNIIGTWRLNNTNVNLNFICRDVKLLKYLFLLSNAYSSYFQQNTIIKFSHNQIFTGLDVIGQRSPLPSSSLLLKCYFHSYRDFRVLSLCRVWLIVFRQFVLLKIHLPLL